MVWALVGGIAIFVLSWAAYGFYRLGASRAREKQSAAILAEQENKDARRNESIAAAKQFTDLLRWEDDNGQGSGDAS